MTQKLSRPFSQISIIKADGLNNDKIHDDDDNIYNSHTRRE